MLATGVPANTVKSVLDVWNSFHSVPVRVEDRMPVISCIVLLVEILKYHTNEKEKVISDLTL